MQALKGDEHWGSLVRHCLLTNRLWCPTKPLAPHIEKAVTGIAQPPKPPPAVTYAPPPPHVEEERIFPRGLTRILLVSRECLQIRQCPAA